MALQLANLDERTRQFMLAELEEDLTHGRLFVSPRLSDPGQADWPDLLRSAIQHGDEEALATSLRELGRLNAFRARSSSIPFPCLFL